ncbi:hypothetical protein TSAR_005170 [Trichomalopsis sarcophagae]|uniref:Uncharacterized protein n=1 Tax=Trichomalopsis sarcophagae TaxID=543379 RepID=A0A232ELB3_9HYME|nr:hypothetical protein TSAR_005170 [Trichomalopsis sarcophagae]
MSLDNFFYTQAP